MGVDNLGNIRDKPIVPKLNYTPEGRFPTIRVGNFAASHQRIITPTAISPHGRLPGPSVDDRSSFSHKSERFWGKPTRTQNVIDKGIENLDNILTPGLNHTDVGGIDFNPGVCLSVRITTPSEPAKRSHPNPLGVPQEPTGALYPNSAGIFPWGLTSMG
jgi:hypothetical protein